MNESGLKAIVVNSSHLELDQLAAELAKRRTVHEYIGRYFATGRAWEKMLQSNSFTRKFFSSGPGRRKPPDDLQGITTFQKGVLWDFAAGMVPRKYLGRTGQRLSHRFLLERDKAIVRFAVRRWNREDAILANLTVAKELFREAAPLGVPRILNYPIAHHAYARRLQREEAELHPEFATDLEDQLPTAEVTDRLEEECKSATTILVGSDFARRSFIESGVPAEKIFASSYGVDVSRFNFRGPRPPDGIFRVAWAGQVTQRKGIKYLLEAWRAIYGPGMELVIAGYFVSGPEPFRAYENLFRRAGFLDAAGLEQLFHSSDVFVLPSIIEGMPLVVLQAMACGLPAIVTTHGPGDIVRDGVDGFHVPIRDADAIAEKLTFLRENPEIRARMGQNARERALTFTWERYRKETGDYVQSVLCQS